MQNHKVWHRIRLTALGLSVLVVLSLFWVLYNVIKDTSGIAALETGVPGVWILIAFQLFVVSVFLRTSKGLLIAVGIVAILYALLLWYMGSTFTGTAMKSTGIILFISAGSDFTAGVLALVLRILWKRKHSKK